MLMACLVVVMVVYLVHFRSVALTIFSLQPVLSTSSIDDKVNLLNTVRKPNSIQLTMFYFAGHIVTAFMFDRGYHRVILYI